MIHRAIGFGGCEGSRWPFASLPQRADFDGVVVGADGGDGAFAVSSALAAFSAFSALSALLH